MHNALQSLVRALWRVVSWLIEQLDDDDGRRAILEELGLDGSAAAPTGAQQADIDAVEAYLGSDDPDVLAFLAVADSLAAVLEAFETYFTSLISGSDSNLTGREARYIVVELFAIELARRDVPLLYTAARAIGFIDDKVGTHLLPTINRQVIEEGITSVYRPLETEEDARRHGDVLNLTAVGLGFLFRFLEKRGLLDLEYDGLAGYDPVLDPFTDPVPALELADSISTRMITGIVRRPIVFGQEEEGGETEEDGGLETTVAPALSMSWIVVPEDHGGPGLFLSLGGELSLDVQARGQRFRAEIDLLEGISFFFVPGENEIGGPAGAGLEIEYLAGALLDEPSTDGEGQSEPALAWPRTTGSRVEIGNFGAGFTARADEVVAKLIFDRSALVLASEDPDSFLASVFPSGGVRVDFDLAFGWDFLGAHLFLGGSAKLEVVIPIGKPLGPLTIFHITIGAGAAEDEDSKLEIVLRLSLSLKLFALTAVVDQIGFRTALRSTDQGGRLGLFDDPEFGFVPPKGIGIQVGGAGVRGGGFLFFDPDNDEYAGVLALEFLGVTLKVVGLIKTNLDASPSFSLLLVGSVEGLRIAIFAGGFLTGIGIIFGMHRTMSVPALQSGIKNRTLDALLFPPDPVANAPRLLEALKTVFPVATDQWIVGISLQASWIDKRMVRIEVALIFEFPTPFRTVLLGQANLGLPTRKVGLLQINFDLVGILDFDNEFLSIDSRIYDSRIGKFPLKGDMAARARWGADPLLAVAVGGLHPRFPLPEGFPKLTRLTVSLGKGKNPRIHGLAYVGFTSNTFQLGVGAELYVGAGGFSLEGDFSFDLLFQFDPFRFLAELNFSASVKFKGRTLAGLKVSGSLTGPGRWRAKGKVRIKLLFIKVTKRFNESWGDPAEEEIEAVEVRAALESALTSSDSWRAQLPSGAGARVSLRAMPPDDVVDVHPLGALEVVQRVVPLGIELDKFENSPIAGERRFDITAATLNGAPVEPVPVREHFAPGQYLDIGEDDAAVSRPSFERFQAGARLSSSAVSRGPGVTTNFAYEEIVLNESLTRPTPLGIYEIPAEAVLVAAEFGAVAKGLRAATGRYAGPIQEVQRVDSGYVVASVDGVAAVPLDGDPLPPDASYTEVRQALDRHLDAHPDARGRVQIVRSYERRTP